MRITILASLADILSVSGSCAFSMFKATMEIDKQVFTSGNNNIKEQASPCVHNENHEKNLERTVDKPRYLRANVNIELALELHVPDDQGEI